METVAVVLAVIFVIMARGRTHDVSGMAAGIGEFFVGLSALIAAVTSLLNRKQLTHVKRKTDKTAASIGSPDDDDSGATVLELLQEIKGFESYQHGRNHDILGVLTRIDVAIPLLIKALEDYQEGR